MTKKSSSSKYTKTHPNERVKTRKNGVPASALQERRKNMKSENNNRNLGIEESLQRPAVSDAVIRRLPRYFRYLRELIRQNKLRISSGELSRMMGVTASQIRQDLNCFGGFGQQGYGYNVNYLYDKICELLGVDAGVQAIIIGAGDLGRALVRAPMFEKRGIEILAMFDVDPAIIGRVVGGVTVRSMDELDGFCADVPVDMAVLTLPKESVEEVAQRLVGLGITGFWNFTVKELTFEEKDVMIENVHLGDSLMILNYRLCQQKREKKTRGDRK